MTRISKIFLDLDDVCNHFTVPALQIVGCPIESEDDYPREVGYDIVAAANKLLGACRYDAKSFWKLIPQVLWESVPPADHFYWLLDACVSLVGKERVCILSCPTEDPHCMAGKLRWIQRYAPYWLRRQFLIGPPKWLCASPGALLIDDSPANVERFRASGGEAVLYPRPWNYLCGESPQQHLQTYFDSLQQPHVGRLQSIGLVPNPA